MAAVALADRRRKDSACDHVNLPTVRFMHGDAGRASILRFRSAASTVAIGFGGSWDQARKFPPTAGLCQRSDQRGVRSAGDGSTGPTRPSAL